MVLGRIFSGLARTRARFASGLGRLLGINRKLDDEFLEELEEVLYTSDSGSTGTEIVEELQESYRQREILETSEVLPFLRTRLLERLEGCEAELA